MSTLTETETPPVAALDVDDDLSGTGACDMVVTLEIGANRLDRYLKLVGDRNGPRIKHLDGSLTLVSPSGPHERTSDRIDGVIKAICEELDIGFLAFVSTLYRLPGRDHGAEPDESYYFANAEKILPACDEGAPAQLDLGIYPPPDLVVETVYGHSASKALKIYAELKVPEVWVYLIKKKTIQFLRLDGTAVYLPVTASLSLPFLTPADVFPWAAESKGLMSNVWAKRVRAWVRDVILPRSRSPGETANKP